MRKQGCAVVSKEIRLVVYLRRETQTPCFIAKSQRQKLERRFKMTKQDFINFLQSQSNITLSEYFCQNLNGFINTAQESELESLSSKILHSKKRFINDIDFLELLKMLFWEQAGKRAAKSKIHKYKGSRYEEQYLLCMYFYKKEVQERRLEWIL